MILWIIAGIPGRAKDTSRSSLNLVGLFATLACRVSCIQLILTKCSLLTGYQKIRMRFAGWPVCDEVEYTGWEIYNDTMYRVVTYGAASQWPGWKEC